jgi:hypothetical protein
VTDLQKHTQMPDSTRTADWEKTFFQLMLSSNVSLMSEAPQEGPDGLPYLLVETKPDSQEPFINILSWLATRGIGLVVNPGKAFPDYIFTYGMIWNFKEFGSFLTEATIQPEKTFSLDAGEKILAGQPHPQYLPDYVRALLREFFLQQGVLKPRILVIGKDDKFDLCFSLESLGNPPQQEHHGVLSAIAWFLPQHYSLALVSEKGLPPFIDL